jgi:hypothetical protein
MNAVHSHRFTAAISGWRNLPAMLLIATLLTGCLFSTREDRHAGAEDFPNTLEPLGKAAVGQIDAQVEWDEFGNIPSAITGLREIDSLIADTVPASGDLPKVAGLAKSAATHVDTLRWDWSDTSQGMARRIYVRSGLGVQRDEDTLVFKYDEAFRQRDFTRITLLARAGKIVRLTGAKSWKFSDRDGIDGVDKAVLRFSIATANALRWHQVEAHVDSVPRGLLDTAADPATLMQWRFFELTDYRFVRLRGGDTLETLDVSDFDGDGRLFAGDSGMVRILHVTLEPPLRPSLVRAEQRSRGWLMRADLAFRPRFYKEEREESDGKRIVFVIRGQASDSAFTAGDTVTVNKEVFWSEPSVLASRRDAFTVVLTRNLGDFSANRLLRLVADWNWRSGLLLRSRFVFAPQEPVAPKQIRARGRVTMSVEYADASSGQLEGDYTGDSLAVVYRETREDRVRHFRVTWDKFGLLQSKAVETH